MCNISSAQLRCEAKSFSARMQVDAASVVAARTVCKNARAAAGVNVSRSARYCNDLPVRSCNTVDGEGRRKPDHRIANPVYLREFQKDTIFTLCLEWKRNVNSITMSEDVIDDYEDDFVK